MSRDSSKDRIIAGTVGVDFTPISTMLSTLSVRHKFHSYVASGTIVRELMGTADQISRCYGTVIYDGRRKCAGKLIALGEHGQAGEQLKPGTSNGRTRTIVFCTMSLCGTDVSDG